ncbi:MAG: hypothetical protein ACJA1F_000497 [Paracoccaceae bacterium]|jgi:hypothetical protein
MKPTNALKNDLTSLKPGHDQGPVQTVGFGAPEIIALALSCLWLALAAMFFLFLEPAKTPGDFDPSVFVMTLLSVFMPIALIWVGASGAKSSRIIRAENVRLQASVDAVHRAYDNAQSTASPPRDTHISALEKRLEQIAETQRSTETLLAQITAAGTDSTNARARVAPRPLVTRQDTDKAQDPERQASLALGPDTAASALPISIEDFIRAMHFPESEDDKVGFRALKMALRDPKVSGLVRSSQDVLTLLSEDRIYMDDLSPDRARAEIWRKFAHGERGRAIASLGGVRDRTSLTVTAGRMRQDPVFRDTAHHFLRKFDKTFAEFETMANDAEIIALSETRTARAFMLLGRVAGTFD